MAKTRKTDTAEFKLPAVRMVTDQHLAVAEVARRLGLTEGRLREWLKAFRAQGADAFPGPGRLAPHDEELHRLRAEVQRLKAERDILKNAAADFARHSTGPSLSSPAAGTGGPSSGCAKSSKSRPPGSTLGSTVPTASPSNDARSWWPP